jgi:phosphatidylglycerophosphatase A
VSLPCRVAALGGLGHLKPAPGTWGSAAVLPLALAGPWACLAAALLFAALGLWAVARCESARADPGWVVVDEAAGQALALAALPMGAPLWSVLLAFALFRLLDIAKPGPVGWADRQEGAVGVMLDDIVAGALAGAALLALRAMGWL